MTLSVTLDYPAGRWQFKKTNEVSSIENLIATAPLFPSYPPNPHFTISVSISDIHPLRFVLAKIYVYKPTIFKEVTGKYSFPRLN